MWRLGVAMVLAAMVLGWSSPGAAADPGKAAAPPAPPVIRFENGRLTVDVRDADLAGVLQQIAASAGFQLVTTGPLGRVSAAFRGLPLEDGLRQLVQDHELMLLYQPASDGRPEGILAEARVFADVGARTPSRATNPERGRDVASTLAEISQLARARDDPGSVTRLGDLLDRSSDPAVRARATWALGRVGGATADTLLTRALSDQSAQVRIQAVYAMGRLEGSQAIPALGGVLLSDSDVTVRRAAARVLGGLTEAASTSALRAAAQDSDPAVRQEVTRALKRHGVVQP